MTEHSLNAIQDLLASSSVDEMRQGLKMIEQEISSMGSENARDLFEILSTLFYLDPMERPDLAPILDEALNLMAGFGNWVVPALLEKLDGCDFKAQLAIANGLGRIGAAAIDPMIQEFKKTQDSSRRAFILYALGKIKSPLIAVAAPLVLEAARSSHAELCDTATRAIGKIAGSIPTGALPEDLRRGLHEQLLKNLASENAGIRSKAMRSLGKLAQYGHLNYEEMEKLKKICEELLGVGERFEWDYAYIVRREAKETLQHVRGNRDLKTPTVH
jgi:hypothetical protein